MKDRGDFGKTAILADRNFGKARARDAPSA
jgi:hypothetical protein